MSILIGRHGPPGSGYLSVQFTYDPVILDRVKAIPGRRWDATARKWIVPATPENVAVLRGMPTKVVIPADLTAEFTVDQSKRRAVALAKARGDGVIAHRYVTTPYAHQRAGLEVLAQGGGGALFWEMGLGKTKTAIDYAEWMDHGGPAFRVLVICPNTIKRNWANEIVKHAGHSDFIVPDGTLAQRAKQFGTARYTIVNCEQLSFVETAKALQAREWDLVIVDESTRFKEPRAKRTKNLLKLRAKHRVILTGTPITGSPEDAWAQMEFVAPGIFGGSFWHFRDHYLLRDFFGTVTGIKPGMEGDLRARIDSRSYRVLKSEVLDLPPKVYADRVVTLRGDQARAYHDMKNDLRIQIENMPVVTAANVLTVLLRLTQVTAGLIGDSTKGYHWLGEDAAKVAELDALLLDELRGEQVVIFGLYQKELEALAARYGDPTSPGILYGPTPEKERQTIIDQFQAGQRRLLFAQVRTGGIGINLTAAKTAIYHTRGWSLEEYLQSQDRLHRIGQTGTVSILHLIASGTVDERIAEALAGKQNLADLLTGDDARKLAAQLVGTK